MEICDGSSGQDTGASGDSTPGVGQDGSPLQKDNQPEAKPPAAEDRTSEAPKVDKKDNPVSPRFKPGNIGKFAGREPKPIVGYPCLNCTHVHKEHSMYAPQKCLLDGCECIGLKIDHSLIPSKFKP